MRRLLAVFCTILIGIFMFISSDINIIKADKEKQKLKIQQDLMEEDDCLNEKINITYEYPMTKDNPEWKNLTAEERYEICQIPKDLIGKMTTYELIAAVMDYPNYSLFTRDDVQAEYEELIDNFDALEILLNRDDFLDEMVIYLICYALPEEPYFDDSKYVHDDSV